MANIEKMKEVLALVEEQPDKHDQGIWSNGCGTQRCLAGWAIALEYYRKFPEVQENMTLRHMLNILVPGEEYFDYGAAAILDIPIDDAAEVFYMTTQGEAIGEFRKLITKAENDPEGYVYE